jgi:hypothetical protein
LLAEANRVASRLTDTDWGRKSGKRCLLLVDEFSGLQAQGRHVAGPINRIREGGVTLWLFTQSYADLNLLGDDTRDRIVGGTDVQVVFRQATADDQEHFSELFGEHEELRREAGVDVLTGQPRGTVKAKRARVRNVPPDALAALPIGQAYVRVEGDDPRLVLFPNFDGQGEDAWAEDEADDGTPVVARVAAAADDEEGAGDVVDVEARVVAPDGELVPALPGESPGERPGENAPRATGPARPSRMI